MHITELPTDIVEEILLECDPIEVAMTAQTCSALRTLIYSSQDSKLWRDLYLAEPFDDLRKCVSQHGHPAKVDWKRNLQRIVRARRIVANLSLLKPGELEEVLQTLLMMILYHPPWSSNNTATTAVASLNLRWISVILHQHGFIDRVEEMTSLTFAERQLLSRLHCYYGLTEKDKECQARVKSRIFVYSMRNYRPENDYGPFLFNGSVNWEHMQALHHVVSMHLFDMKEAGLEFPSFPMSLPLMQMVIPPVRPDGEEGKENLDWVGFEGSWGITFCFCDHRELFGEFSSLLFLLLWLVIIFFKKIFFSYFWDLTKRVYVFITSRVVILYVYIYSKHRWISLCSTI